MITSIGLGCKESGADSGSLCDCRLSLESKVTSATVSSGEIGVSVVSESTLSLLGVSVSEVALESTVSSSTGMGMYSIVNVNSSDEQSGIALGGNTHDVVARCMPCSKLSSA